MATLTRNVQTITDDGGITMWRIGATPPSTVHDQIPADAWDDHVEAPAGPPTGTVDEIKSWVGDDSIRAQVALDVEQAGSNRSTLVAWLETVITDGAG